MPAHSYELPDQLYPETPLAVRRLVEGFQRGASGGRKHSRLTIVVFSNLASLPFPSPQHNHSHSSLGSKKHRRYCFLFESLGNDRSRMARELSGSPSHHAAGKGRNEGISQTVRLSLSTVVSRRVVYGKEVGME